MQVGEICTRDIVFCDRCSSVVEIARLMRNHHVGDIIVSERRDSGLVPVGVVTDRDLAIEVLAQEVDPRKLSAGDLIDRELVTVAETDAVYNAIWLMRSKGVRRLPVVNQQGLLIGVLTADDVIEFLAEELSELARVVPRQVKLEQTARATLPA
jgi:CBS domain-containing protein